MDMACGEGGFSPKAPNTFLICRYRYTVHPDGFPVGARDHPMGVPARHGYPRGVVGADYPMGVRNNRKFRLYHPSYPGQQKGD